ncbi:hypothetical protein BDQ17DRAFT_1364183 [Cyathus striatus]|nr:hypothetical protein BDQ17DRAFT_1364183 [Cyathus striatus]
MIRLAAFLRMAPFITTLYPTPRTVIIIVIGWRLSYILTVLHISLFKPSERAARFNETFGKTQYQSVLLFLTFAPPALITFSLWSHNNQLSSL